MEHSRKQKLFVVLTLFIAIVSLTVGFAAFSTTLNISSSANITPTSDTFSVKFSIYRDSYGLGEVPTVTSGIETTQAVISNGANPTLSNLSATFTNPGQYAYYPLFIRNEGEYIAYLNSINFIGEKVCVAEPGTSPELVQSACDYINASVFIGSEEFTETTQLSNYQLESSKGIGFSVKLNYSEQGPQVDGPFKIVFPSISLVYSTVDNSNTLPQVLRIISGDINTIGSVIAIGNEQFYIYGHEENNVKLLSMYNLYLGNNVDSSGIYPIKNPSYTQHEDAKGVINDGLPDIAVLEFDNDSNQYSGSTIATHVNNYKEYLTGLGVDVRDARLITKEELEELGCNSSKEVCTGAPSWVTNTSYWTGTAVDTNKLYCVYKYNVFASRLYSYKEWFGVRPVIIISKTEL